jgi:hypothetical protein
MNRKGQALGTGMLYIIYFLMMAMIAGGLYGGIISFFGKGYDIREFDVKALRNSIKTCMAEENLARDIFINESVFSERCSIDEEILNNEAYLVFINNSQGKEFFRGVYDYRVRCGFNGKEKNFDLPKCDNYCKDNICVLTASAQKSRRVAS